ncbi:MAG TPA: kanamycin nucleotidyltransferase C-terminal domain-containing protein [Thermoplasmata archaeon]|nr:kanamycin nucleotidyltransferase C-terminal domain-containing protein [Thermoplasmata archaeon]HLA46636.1 kanamycin nucleotidyltransferase C-terminal domain-containing protein [Thermoplasmata archaeon]
MERARRRRLAEELAARVVKSRGDIVSVVLFGSVARGDDGTDSDVEIAAIARRGLARREVDRFILDGVLFGVYWYNAAGLRRQMLEPEGDATKHGFLDGVPLYDSTRWFERLKREVADLPPSFYHRSAEDALHQMYEYVCKARNARRRRDDANIAYATGVVGYEARVLAALLNRRHYRSENTMTDEWLQFPDLPEDFQRKVKPLVEGSVTLRVRYESAMALWRLCREWAATCGVRLRVVRRLPARPVAKTR